MNEIEVLSVMPEAKMKHVELLTFNKIHELEYKGYCQVKANEFQQSLIIEQDGETDRLAPINREFIRFKNMLCILAPNQKNDIIIFFKKEQACKRIHDFVTKKKSKYNCIASHVTVEQLYKERFLTPLLTAVDRTQNMRLIEIAKVLNDEDSPAETVNKYVCDIDDDMYDVKPFSVIKSEFLPLAENIPLVNSAGISSILTTGSLPNENSSLCQNLSTEKPPLNRKRSYPSSDANLDHIENAAIEKLHVYTSSDKEFWYEFICNADNGLYFCDGCQKDGKLIEAEIHFHENEYFVTVDDVEHICKELTHPPNDPQAASENNDDFEKENEDAATNKTFSDVQEQSILIAPIIEPCDVISNPCETILNKSEFSSQPTSPRSYNPREIFAPDNVIPKDGTPAAASETIATGVMPLLESISANSSSTVGANVPDSAIHVSTFSGNGIDYRMPVNQNGSSPRFIHRPINESFPVNAPGNVDYVPRSVLSTLLMSSPSVYSNNPRPPVNAPFSPLNGDQMSNSPFPWMSSFVPPPLSTHSASRFMVPSFYAYQQLCPDRVGSNLASSSIQPRSSQSNSFLTSHSDNNRVQKNFNISPASMPADQIPHAMFACNNSMGAFSDRNNFSRSLNSNSVLISMLSKQNVPSNPGIPTSSGSYKPTADGENFLLSPNQKGVPNMKLEIKMTNNQSYIYTFYSAQDAYLCERCKNKGQKTSAKLCQIPSGEICVVLGEMKHICTMPYTNEILLYSCYEISKIDGGYCTLTIFDSVNMDLGYEYQCISNKSTAKFVCKNCDKLKKKEVTARICVDHNDKQCIALNTDAHECKMQNFVHNGRIVKQPGYKKIKTSNGEEGILIFYDQVKYRRFIRDRSTNDYHCEACKNANGRNTIIKIRKDQNNQEFLFVCGLHWCKPLLGPASII
uniref:Uncharacterized protein n=1 Tax=Panagrolaimus superbus TaxID=310955 RepID=A0A914YXQ4_9BILA